MPSDFTDIIMGYRQYPTGAIEEPLLLYQVQTLRHLGIKAVERATWHGGHDGKGAVASWAPTLAREVRGEAQHGFIACVGGRLLEATSAMHY